MVMSILWSLKTCICALFRVSPGRTKAEQGLDHVLEMCDHRLHASAWFSFDRDDIDLPVVNFVFGGIVFSGGEHVLLFSWRYRDFRQPHPVGGTRLDFDEEGHIILPCNDIYLPIRCADIAGYDFAASFCEPIRGNSFAPTADSTVVCGTNYRVWQYDFVHLFILREDTLCQLNFFQKFLQLNGPVILAGFVPALERFVLFDHEAGGICDVVRSGGFLGRLPHLGAQVRVKAQMGEFGGEGR